MNWITSVSTFQAQTRPENPYFAGAYDFIKAWLDGQQQFVLYTSGSTGTPKPITVSRNQLSASARMTGEALQLGAGTKALVCLNVRYVAGLMMLVRGMELNWELTIVEPSSNPLESPELIGFDFVSMVPVQLQAVLEDSLTREKLHVIGKILLGGAPVNVTLQKEIEALAAPVYQSYGMTETVSHVALKKLNGTDAHSHYTFLPGIRFGTDDRGCLFISGPVTNNELVQTNDLVEITGNRFKWVGRADNVINSGGIKIVLDQVDAAVAEVFYTLGLDNAFFSWFEKDEKWGQKLILIVEGEGSQSIIEKITIEIRKGKSAYETPKDIYFAARFARTPTDKVDKRQTALQLFKA